MPFLDTVHTVGKKPSMFGERKINQSIKTSLLLCTCRSDSNQMVSFFFFLSFLFFESVFFFFFYRKAIFGPVWEICYRSSFVSSVLLLQKACVGVCACVCVWGQRRRVYLYQCIWLCTHPAFIWSRNYLLAKRTEKKI